VHWTWARVCRTDASVDGRRVMFHCFALLLPELHYNVLRCAAVTVIVIVITVQDSTSSGFLRMQQL
jgi:hypothetical protein